MKKVVVIGSTGMLGYSVSEYFRRKKYSVSTVSRLEFDIVKDQISKLEEILKGNDLVINCAGVIKPMIAKTSIEHVLQVNTILTAPRWGHSVLHVLNWHVR